MNINRKFERWGWLLLASIFLFYACQRKPRSYWKEGTIAVMADSTDWIGIQPELRAAFERVVRTPQKESYYSLRWVSQSEFDRYLNYRYLILAGTLQSTGRVGELVKGVVTDPQIRSWVEEGKYFYFIQKEQWAKDQFMLILVCPDLEELKDKIETNASILYEIIDMDFREKLLEDMFKKGEQTEIEKRLMAFYGWSIRVQHDYFLAQEVSEKGFLWFRRMYPERWIFVRWIDGGDMTMLNQEWVVSERNRIGGEYYSGDRVSDRYLYSSSTHFLGRPALFTAGLWENTGKVAGGPFRNHTFYDELSRRVYMIDVAVFNPGEDKTPYLIRLDVIANTFRTIFDPE
ncbi:MAG TPA: DUF4837 family protein [bacterium]|nr:DUF4837 family protein [bacterium]